MGEYPTGTVTFLFTDIEGSTRLWEQRPEAMGLALARHDAQLRQAIEGHQGYVFKTVGDAVCAAFATAREALDAALAGQRALASTTDDRPPTTDHGRDDRRPTTGEANADDQTVVGGRSSVVLKVRMALHTGVAEARDGDYFGPPLNRVARLLAAGAGGQVLLSSVSHELLRGDLPDGCSLRDLGEHHLKDLGEPERIYQLVAPDLPADFPPLKTLDTYPNNLPLELTRFIGRERETAEAKRLLSTSRLLTLIGPGGAGKTRLATHVAADLLPDYPDGVWLVELAPLADPSRVLQTVATVFNLREAPNVPLAEMLVSYLRNRRALLLLDNCEHLIDACAHLADGLLHACPQVTILASSREALGIAGETVQRVPPLSLPDPGDSALDAIARSEAVQLFVDRATAVQPRFALTQHSAAAIAQVCRRLDAIPLALELAAARVRVLTPEQIATRLDDRFRLLTGGSRTALPRQQTLRALIDWSYDLLPDEERALLRRLSVFAGGWTLEATEAVYPNHDVLDLLTQLVDKSLVLVDDSDADTARYRLLETIRQYARDRLLEAGEAVEARDLHLRYYSHAVEVNAPEILGPTGVDWLDECEREHDNYRAALEWGLERDPEAALRLAGVLASFWSARGYRREGYEWLKGLLARLEALPPTDGEAERARIAVRARGLLALSNMSIAQRDSNQVALEASSQAVGLYEQLGEPRLLAFGLAHTGFIAAIHGRIDVAEGRLTEAIALARQTNSRGTLAMALGTYGGLVLVQRGEVAGARAALEESARVGREVGELWGAAQATMGLAHIAGLSGEWDEARTSAREAMAVFDTFHDRHLLNAARSELAHVERHAGNLAEARRLYRETLVAWHELGQRSAAAHEMECLAYIDRAEAHYQRAARLLGAAEVLRERIGIPMLPLERAEYDREVAALREQLDPAALGSEWAAGRALALDEAVTYALGEKADPNEH